MSWTYLGYGAIESGDEAEKDDVDVGEYDSYEGEEAYCATEDLVDDVDETERQRWEADRRADSGRVPVGPSDDAVENYYWNALREVDAAMQQSMEAARTATALRQSNRELLESVMVLERVVRGQSDVRRS
ncbi:hypothetical protein PInf_007377 [Phytophthora infestans]|nr:hypothetical protein PInf_007377 [Phytophthora infestans]